MPAAPSWQQQYSGWDLVPQVPYESGDEFLELLEGFRVGYCKLARDCVASSLESSAMLPLSISYYGLIGIEQGLTDAGHVWFLRLTKGVGAEWCAAMNCILIQRLNAAARTFFHYHIQPSSDDRLDEHSDSLNEMLEREVCLFAKHYDFPFNGYYPFNSRNFILYASIPCAAQFSNKDCMPVGKFQAIMLAFAMGSHARLGDRCLVGALGRDLIEHLFSWGVF